MHSHDYTANLNPPQKEAVLHELGPILVIAGAGTGKTRVLTRRIAHLVLEKRVHPSAILAVTFTNKACAEMRERLRLLLGDGAERLWISTFHSMGLRILRRHATHLGYRNDFFIYDSDDTKTLIKSILKKLNIDDKKYPPSLFTSYIDKQKNIPAYPENVRKDPSKHYADLMKQEVYSLYQQELQSSNSMDFGDLLANTHRLFTQFPEVLQQYQRQLDFLLVDEFQDTNKVQYDCIRMLTGQKKNLLVVGDDDQSIYAFRGATIQNILYFEKDFPNTKVVTLDQNYRSTKNILECAHSVIQHNHARKEKHVWTESAKGNPIYLFSGRTESEEAHFIAKEIADRVNAGLNYRDIAIFYRTNAQSRSIEEAFSRYRIPYRIFGGLKFYERKEIKDAIAYLRLIANPGDNQAFLRVINTPTRGIGAQSVANLQIVAAENSLSLFEAGKNFTKPSSSIRQFISLISQLQSEAPKLTLGELVNLILEKSGYVDRLKALKDDPTAQSRIENLNEFAGMASNFSFASEEDASTTLIQFLDQLALSTADETPSGKSNMPISEEEKENCVSLMTLHLAKGLEFEMVFFTGFEEGLVPHARSIEDPEQMEEERRLCYVGMTRARHNLFLTRSLKRSMFAKTSPDSGLRQVSRFAFDIPATMTEEKSKNLFFVDPMTTFIPHNDEFFGMENSSFSSSRAFKESTKRSVSDLLASGLLKSAEPKATPEAAPSREILNLPLLEANEAVAGKAVAHPYFGEGVIEEIKGDVQDTVSGFKVVIRFKSNPLPKTLVFRNAQLRALNTTHATHSTQSF